MKTLTIYPGKNQQFLNVDLIDILKCIDDGNKLHWNIQWIEAYGINELKDAMIDFEELVNNSQDDLLLDWPELRQYSNSFSQIINGLIVGDYDKHTLRKYTTDEELYSSCRYVLELIDSAYWEIHSKDEKLYEKLNESLQDVTLEFHSA